MENGCLITEIMIYCRYGKTIEPGGFTPLIFRRVQSSPPDERKEGETMYVTFLASIIIAVMAGVVSHRINKWLESKDESNNK